MSRSLVLLLPTGSGKKKILLSSRDPRRTKGSVSRTPRLALVGRENHEEPSGPRESP